MERTGPPSAYTVSALDQSTRLSPRPPSPSRAWPGFDHEPRAVLHLDLMESGRGGRHRHEQRAAPVDALREAVGLGAVEPEQTQTDLRKRSDVDARGQRDDGAPRLRERDLTLPVVVYELRDRRNSDRDGLTVERGRHGHVGDPECVEHALQLLGVALDAELVLAATSIDVSVKPGGSHVGVCKRIPAAALASLERRVRDGRRRRRRGRDLLADQRRQSTEELDHSCAIRCGSNATPAKFTTRK